MQCMAVESNSVVVGQHPYMFIQIADSELYDFYLHLIATNNLPSLALLIFSRMVSPVTVCYIFIASISPYNCEEKQFTCINYEPAIYRQHTKVVYLMSRCCY